MPEVTTTVVVGGFAAAVSTVTLSLLGVEYFALLWGFIGAIAALWQAGTMKRSAAVIFVVMSTILGAAFGSGAVALIGTSSRALLIVLSLVGGAGAQIFLGAAIKRGAELIASLGAKQ